MIKHTDRRTPHAVLTGDIVASSRLEGPARRELRQAMVDGFAELNIAYDGVFEPEIDIFRGDSWQLLTSTPGVALRAAIYFRAELRARMGSHRLDTRVAIGVGGVELEPGRRVSQGDGSAYRRSGRALETMPRTRRMTLRLEDQPLGPGFDEMLGVVDHIVSRWTDKQAQAVTGALRGWTQERIASHWDRLGEGPVSQQTVAQHLQRAGWHAVAPALDFLDGLLA